MTKQRQLIYDIITKSNSHLTADSIHKLAQKKIPSIAIGTVYRNLNLMCDAGEIMRVVIADAPDRFDKNPVYHDHIICDRCGTVSDICTDDLKKILSAQTGISVTSYDLTIHYVCDECQKNKYKFT